MMRAFLILLLCCFLLGPAFLGAGAARADDDLSGFATGNFNRTREAVEALGTSADPRAAAVISALQNGMLYYTPGGAVLIKGDDGSFSDAQTGQAVPDTAGAKPVRLNNAIRSAIDAALGGLRLFDPQPGVRLQAADAVFKSHDPAALAGLTRALAKEADPAVKRRMEQARAAVILSKSDSSERDKL
ncbi:MAG TPA: urea ABC transporter permease subunit UrtB, partial [Rhodopila sp.]|nr:urea ABC transporter permease subunit UrtB [Rhodopila sp.]